MPSINFVSSYNIASSLGAKIYLADVNKYDGQMSPEDVISCAKKFKIKKIKAVITMFNSGYPKNAEQFGKLKKMYGCFIIEDACHALGGSYKINEKIFKIGSCKHSDISTFSLHPLKTITTGEGGIVTTNNKKFDTKIKILRSIGIKRNNLYHWKYNVIYNGLNFRMNDFQCALGINQLKKIKSFVKAREKIAKNYSKELINLHDITIPKTQKKYISANHLYLINIRKGSLSIKDKLIKYMLRNNIFLQYHYIPIYKFDVFKGKYIGENAEIYYKSTVSLPIFYGLKKEQQNYIIKKLISFFK